ncbi:T6SS immunity protein Tdi1 domain-containing protein [Streptomyces chiangmaiensis]|uniref:T6SS immunity protein Tdi1 domain-containing protein n=1 Tax=Streptomyces chiangmaiensis TaxID=766497 RepID=A0ABU7F8N6_9ACTN|nr:T6SS immunity protein Tdi1 domain-containing protein [Streptomyces chiangmaiensis]MED7820430.1 T6SS immunity protein Tdi1 domain-containing protein [Streptomyces chiangmaiensis]
MPHAEELPSLADHVGPRSDPSAAAGTPAEHFPAAHRELLLRLNGFTVHHGAFRILGIGREEPALDLTAWNAPDTWRFAWDDRIEPFVIFGETAFGDSYAYHRLPGGGLAPEVHFLEGVLLRPEIIASSFEAFLADELLRNAKEPYDHLVVEAVRRLGSIAPDRHWVYVPSVALGGEEAVENITVLPATAAMTFAGDIATAMQGADRDATGVEPYMDERGRPRLRVRFDR